MPVSWWQIHAPQISLRQTGAQQPRAPVTAVHQSLRLQQQESWPLKYITTGSRVCRVALGLTVALAVMCNAGARANQCHGADHSDHCSAIWQAYHRHQHRLRGEALLVKRSLSVRYRCCHHSGALLDYAVVWAARHNRTQYPHGTQSTTNHTINCQRTFTSPCPQATLQQLKKKFHAAKRKFYPSRQRLSLPPKEGQARGEALTKDGARLSDMGVGNGTVLQFKDLGPQVGKRRPLAPQLATTCFSLGAGRCSLVA